MHGCKWWWCTGLHDQSLTACCGIITATSGLRGTRWQNPLGGGSRDDVHSGTGEGEPLRLFADNWAQSSLHDNNICRKICEEVRNSKNMVFNVKMLLNDGMDPKAADNQFPPANRVNADIYLELLRQHVVPGSRGHILREKYIFRQILHWPTPTGPPSSSWRNSGLWQIGRHK